jgi:putative acetyltransferase
MIQKARPNDFAVIADIWERSVRATHHFLPEDYLQKIKTLLPSILPAVPVYVYRNDIGNISGFLGVDGEKVEMLFIDPQQMGKGIGRKLMQYALNELRATKVDVNEDNAEAASFYKHLGFAVISRSEVDGLGKPFPLLHMELRK